MLGPQEKVFLSLTAKPMESKGMCEGSYLCVQYRIDMVNGGSSELTPSLFSSERSDSLGLAPNETPSP